MFKNIFKNFLNAFINYDPIAGYGNLEISDPKYALKNLRTYYSKAYAEIVWDNSCEAVGISEGDSSPEDLLKVYKHMSQQDDLVGVVGRSLYVKLLTYLKLSEKTINQDAQA